MFFLQNRSRNIRCLAFSPDSRFLASAAGRGRTVRLWNLEQGRQTGIFRGHEYRVEEIAFSPDGVALASVSFRTIKLWDYQQARELPSPANPGYHSRMAFVPDGRLLIVSWHHTANYQIRLLDLVAGLEKVVFTQQNRLTALAISPDGKTLATTGFDNLVKLRHLNTGINQAALRQRATVFGLTFSPDGQTLAAAQGWSPVLWDLASSKEITVLKGHRGPVWSVAYAPEGNLLASAGTDGTIRFWDPVSGRERVAFDWQLGRTRVVAFSPDGMRAAAGGDEGIAVWDVDAV